jgi:hypothetical protein
MQVNDQAFLDAAGQETLKARVRAILAAQERKAALMRFALATLGYVVPTFILGFVWHLVLFKDVYDAFGVYNRPDPIIPLGLGTMVLQGLLLAWLYSRAVDAGAARSRRDALVFQLVIGLFFVSGTIVALAAKAQISNLPGWFAYNFAFSALQFGIAGAVFGQVFHAEK